ncbi:MAG: hypothetical protein MUQ00_00130 [Candidatus Aminicenantes bacterium]|nr:hypothetical protein [Candidatus Aminicenantes bacterium]
MLTSNPTSPYSRSAQSSPGFILEAIESMRHPRQGVAAVFLALFLLSVIVRVGLFCASWGNLRHASSEHFGSTALGLLFGKGLTLNSTEAETIARLPNNHRGDFREFYTPDRRIPSTRFLPGPSFLLWLLWKVFGVYNFAPYIALQIILEALCISFFYLCFKRETSAIFRLITIILIFNFPGITKTLEMGYDFWPSFCVMVSFIGTAWALKATKNKPALLVTGIMAGLTIWFRETTSFLPFYISVLLFFYWRSKSKRSLKDIVFGIAVYLLPVVVSVAALSFHRYELTGNFRPTFSPFWNTFWAGVGQFPNPYHISAEDSSIWNLGKKLDSRLDNHALSEMFQSPNSLYEKTLKKEAIRFLKKRPFLFLRNAACRVAIMIAPPLYNLMASRLTKLNRFSALLANKSSALLLVSVGVILMVLWFSGMLNLYKRNNLVFWLSITIYIYFFFTSGFFYLVGRTILPFLFLNVLVYFFGTDNIVRAVMIHARKRSRS